MAVKSSPQQLFHMLAFGVVVFVSEASYLQPSMSGTNDFVT